MVQTQKGRKVVKQNVFIVKGLIEAEYYADSPTDFEETKQQIREDFKDFTIKQITVSDKPELREVL